MSVRVTTQNVEVLGKKPGTMRVTRVFLEVLGPAFEFTLQSDLLFTQDHTAVTLSPSVSSELTFVSSFQAGIPINVDASSAVSFQNVATANQIVIDMPQGTNPDDQNQLFLVDSVVFGGTWSPFGSNALAFIQTAEFEHIPGPEVPVDADSEINFVSTVTLNGEFTRPMSSAIVFESAVTYFVEYIGARCNYTPWVGSTTGVDSPTPPPTTVPTLGTATLTLTYPYVAPSLTLILRNPIFGDQNSLQFNRIQRESRGGTVQVSGDSSWPRQETLRYSIEGLTDIQADEYLDFLAASLGKEIGLLDHENRQWKGIILTPDAEVTDAGHPCRFSVTLEFEGELV